MTVTLYLMGYKGFAVLRELCSSGLSDSICAVVGARDKAVEEDYFDSLSTLAGEHGITFIDRVGSPAVSDSDYSIAIGWRWLISDKNLIVLHDSLLPRYRGFAPVVSALINGEEEIGATALFASEEYDRGDIIRQRAFAITYPITIQEAIEKLSMVYVEIVKELIVELQSGNALIGTPQNEESATYSLWRDESDYRLDWTNSADKICRFVNALGFPYRGASTLADGVTYRIRKVSLVDDVKIENRKAGKIIFMHNGTPTVVCGSGLLRIEEMVTEDGSNALPLKKFRIQFY